MARRRERSVHAEFQLCSADGPLGPKVMRRISRWKGEQMVRNRLACRIDDSEGKLLGYQLLAASQDVLIMRDSSPSSAAFSVAEREAIAGIRGESRTASFSDGKRMNRIRRGLREMDLVEAARVKLDVYPFVH